MSPQDNPDKWVFVVDQDITPDWFDAKEHEKAFREAVCDWWNAHVLVDKKINELSSGFYRLKRCEVKRLCNDVRVLLYGSQVGEMRGSSQVGEMWGSSTARDYKNYPNVKIWVSPEGKFEMVAHKNEK